MVVALVDAEGWAVAEGEEVVLVELYDGPVWLTVGETGAGCGAEHATATAAAAMAVAT